MDIDEIETRVRRAIAPVEQANLAPEPYRHLFVSARRTDAGRTLPAYYLIYFLLVDLLGFRNDGRWDKTAWSIAVSFEGTPFLIEHRKFGLGIFAIEGSESERLAGEVAMRLHRACRAAQPYFEWRAEQAARQSQLNVVNRSCELFEHFQFHLEHYQERSSKAEACKGEVIKTQTGPNSWTSHHPASALRREARHYAIAALDAFFSWTEHVFIHIAILRGTLGTGDDVGTLARAEWSDKYKAALDLADPESKRFHDELMELRRRFRNVVAHGSFGKDGQAFQFHSGAGAVPLLLPHRRTATGYRFGNGIDLRPAEAISLVTDFIRHLWSGARAPAKIFIQDHGFPAVLTHAADGTYAEAMQSIKAMQEFADYWAHRLDSATNMDF